MSQKATTAEVGKVFEVTDTWACTCGAEYKFGAWAAAHWDCEIVFTCTQCGKETEFIGGEVIE